MHLSTAAAFVAQRRRHEAAEAAANLGEEGTPRALPLPPRKKKAMKIETKPTLPYQQEVFDFYQDEKIQIVVAVRGPAASRHHNCPALSHWPGIRSIDRPTKAKFTTSTPYGATLPLSRRALTTTAPHHRSTARRPPPAWLQLLIVANFIFSIAEKEYDPYPDNVRPHLSPPRLRPIYRP